MKNISQRKGIKLNGLTYKSEFNVGVRYNNVISHKKEGYHYLISTGGIQRYEYYIDNSKSLLNIYITTREFNRTSHDNILFNYYL